MKQKIFKSRSDAEKAQRDDDKAANLPIPGRYIDGSLAPPGHGETRHMHDVREHPKGKQWAYPAQDGVDLGKDWENGSSNHASMGLDAGESDDGGNRAVRSN